MKTSKSIDRRFFMKTSAILATGSLGLALPSVASTETMLPEEDRVNVIGPREGFSPQIGTLVSMMSWMRMVVLSPVKGMTTDQLDFVFDSNSNSIGAMLLHLAATERYYQLHTFENRKWGDWPLKDKERFEAASELGDEGRKKIKGNPLEFYLNTLNEIRDITLKEFKKRDDQWLMAVDTEWYWGPTNNYCKWFHVCEHESNHNGQIKWIKGRLPGAKSAKD